jgi:hypothetical protein
MWSIVRRTIDGLVTLTAPMALFVALGADVWIRVAFGSAYAPAAMSLRVQAPLFLVTYLNAALAMTLIVRNRGWALTGISAAGVLVNPIVALMAIPLFARVLGPGGGGVGSGFGVLAGELVVCTLQLVHAPSGWIGARLWRNVARTALTCAITGAVHVLLAPLGPARLAIDAVVYVVVGTLTGAVRPRELMALVDDIVGSRRAKA